MSSNLSQRNILLIITAFFVVITSSCGREGVSEIVPEELFSLSIGPLDEQINLFRIPGRPVKELNDLFMRDGLFYLANGNSKKMMQLSSYGELILLIYDPSSNAKPVGLVSVSSSQSEEIESNDSAATRRSFSYPFNEIGSLVVDSLKRIHIIEVIQNDRQVFDEEHAIRLSHVVQRFSRQGEHMDFLGQEGIGGTPFPYIHQMFVTAADDLVVVCRTLEHWLIYWFNLQGKLLYRTELSESLIFPQKDEVTIWDVIPRLDSKQLMLFVDVNSSDEEIERKSYFYDVTLKKLLNYFSLPDSSKNKVDFNSNDSMVDYYPLGITNSGHMFLTRPENDKTFSLIVLSSKGGLVSRRLLKLEHNNLRFVKIGMTESGVIFGMLADSVQVRIIWWRTDLIISERKGWINRLFSRYF